MAEADVVLVVDCDVPWFPARSRPADDATVIQLAVDPFYSRYPMRSYPCDIPLAADPAAALSLLAAAVRSRVDATVVAARRARLAAAHRAQREAWARAAAGGGRAHAHRLPVGLPVHRRGAGARHPRRQRVPAGSPPRPADRSRNVLRVAALGRAGVGSGRRARRQARGAGEDRHRDGGRRGLHLRRSDGRPPRGPGPQAPVPDRDLQQRRLGGRRARHALGAPRRLGGDDRDLPADRTLARPPTTRRSCAASAVTESESRIRRSCPGRCAGRSGSSERKAGRPP